MWINCFELSWIDNNFRTKLTLYLEPRPSFETIYLGKSFRHQRLSVSVGCTLFVHYGWYNSFWIESSWIEDQTLTLSGKFMTTSGPSFNSLSVKIVSASHAPTPFCIGWSCSMFTDISIPFYLLRITTCNEREFLIILFWNLV